MAGLGPSLKIHLAWQGLVDGSGREGVVVLRLGCTLTSPGELETSQCPDCALSQSLCLRWDPGAHILGPENHKTGWSLQSWWKILRALSLQQCCSTLVEHWNHTGNFNTHTQEPHKKVYHTHIQETWVCPRDSDFTSPWDIARVLGFCSAAEIEKDCGGGCEKQEQGLREAEEL